MRGVGGDAIFARLKEHLGVGHDETTQDGSITLEHLECNAACDYAPVMMVNWEFFDDQTPESAVALVDELRADRRPTPSRGASLCTFAQVSRVLAGFPDGKAGEGPSAGPASLAGLRLARRLARRQEGTPSAQAPDAGTERAVESAVPGAGSGQGPASAQEPASAQGPAPAPSAHDRGLSTAESDPASDAATGNRTEGDADGTSGADAEPAPGDSTTRRPR